MPFTDTQALLPAALDELVAIAARAIHHELAPAVAGAHVVATPRPELQSAGASFVTLKQGQALRGCIGSLEARRALVEDVAANAVAAAFRDPRFPPLAAGEFALTIVQVAVLSPATALEFGSEDDLYAQLRPGSDGLIIEHRGRRATYLPSVWETLPQPRAFVSELRRKAGIERSVAMTALTVFRYATQHSMLRTLSVA